MVAAGAHFAALARDKVTFYTAPIKALVSEKFFDLCKLFGTENVGMLTGDASVNADAPSSAAPPRCSRRSRCATARTRTSARSSWTSSTSTRSRDRGWAWQIPMLELPQAQFVLMSATLGDVSLFEKDLTRRTGRPRRWSAPRPARCPCPTSTG